MQYKSFKAMKRFMFAILFLSVLTSCYVTDVQPRYDDRDGVIGFYDMKEYSETYNDYTYYGLRITKDGSSGRTLYLNNFYGANIRVHAYLQYGKLTIPYQIVDDYEIEGVGTIHGHAISLNYTVRDLYENTITDFCETWGELE